MKKLFIFPHTSLKKIRSVLLGDQNIGLSPFSKLRFRKEEVGSEGKSSFRRGDSKKEVLIKTNEGDDRSAQKVEHCHLNVKKYKY